MLRIYGKLSGNYRKISLIIGICSVCKINYCGETTNVVTVNVGFEHQTNEDHEQERERESKKNMKELLR